MIPDIFYFVGERDVESVEDDAEDIPLPEVPAVNVPAGPTFGFIPSYYSFVPNIDLVSRIRGMYYIICISF